MRAHQHANQYSEGKTVKECEPQNAPLMPVPFRGCGSDDDALGVDHLAHDAARAVGSRHQDRIDVQLLGTDTLKAAEEYS